MKRRNDRGFLVLPFGLSCVSGLMAGYVLLQDRFVPLDSIWNSQLGLLAGIFIFAVIYEFEFFVISFWLLMGLFFADAFMGFRLGTPGPTCWSGFVVWALASLGGFAGCAVSFFIAPQSGLMRSLKR